MGRALANWEIQVEELKLSDFAEELRPMVVFLNGLLSGIKELNATVREGFKEIRDSHATKEDIGFIHSRVDAQSKRIDSNEIRIEKYAEESKIELDTTVTQVEKSFNEKLGKIQEVFNTIRNTIIAIIIAGVAALLFASK